MFLVTLVLLGSLVFSPVLHSAIMAMPDMMGGNFYNEMREEMRGNQNDQADRSESGGSKTADYAVALREKVTPGAGIYLPVAWRDLGSRLIANKIIEPDKFEQLYQKRGGLNSYEQKLLKGGVPENLYVDAHNARVILNLLWGLGLANKSDVYVQGPMGSDNKDLANFASTGGWTLARGTALGHFNKHSLIKLTVGQEALVAQAAKNIYRPCCDNATYFPDCNHGMAMLGLLELMASQEMSLDQMYQNALAVNAYWFPDTYINIAQYLDKQGQDWSQADAAQLLGRKYSSGSGYHQILSQVTPIKSDKGSGCAV